MLRFLCYFIVGLMSFACSSGSPGRLPSEPDDFSLDPVTGPDKVDNKAYFSDLERSEAAVGFESSFPLPFAVGKSIDGFESVPDQAKSPPTSQLNIYLGQCRFVVRTSTTQVDRFILAGQWIKLNEGLPAGVPVRLEPHMDLNIRVISRLLVEIAPSQMNICRSLLSGRRVFLGRFHLNKSKIGLLSGPGFPRLSFVSRSVEPPGKRIFIFWQPGAPGPVIIDDFDFPATSESGIFRTLLGDKGYYYLVFQPLLRMDKVDQLVIRIPFSPSSGETEARAKKLTPIKKPIK